eukprot:4944001-Amphidinium_carterae.1
MAWLYIVQPAASTIAFVGSMPNQLQAMRNIAKARGDWGHLHQYCEVHQCVCVCGRIFVRCFDKMIPEHIRGMLHAALSLRYATGMASFRRCLKSVIKEKLVIMQGTPSSTSTKYRQSCMELFLPDNGSLVKRMLLQHLPNGDWRDSSVVQYYPSFGEATSISSIMEEGLTYSLAPPAWPNHRWIAYKNLASVQTWPPPTKTRTRKARKPSGAFLTLAAVATIADASQDESEEEEEEAKNGGRASRVSDVVCDLAVTLALGLDALEGLVVAQDKATASLEVEGGRISFYSKKNCFEAVCCNKTHGKCVLTQKNQRQSRLSRHKCASKAEHMSKEASMTMLELLVSGLVGEEHSHAHKDCTNDAEVNP